MGKSTAAEMMRRLGVPVHDADATVHRLMAPGGPCFQAIAEKFPETVVGEHIDRKALGALVFNDQQVRKQLEAIVHPRVRQAERSFLNRCSRQKRVTVVLDIPLLFETKGENRCDRVIVVTAPKWLQQKRVLRRPGMTLDKFKAILAAQTPDAIKRKRADFIIHTGLGYALTQNELRATLMTLRSTPPQVWPLHYRHQ